LEAAYVPEESETLEKDAAEDEDPWKMTPEEFEGASGEKAPPLGESPRPETRPSELDPRINRGEGAMGEIQRKRQIVWGESTVRTGEETEKQKKRRLRFGGDLDPPTNAAIKLVPTPTDPGENVSLDDVIANRNITYVKKTRKLQDGDIVDLMPVEELDYDSS